MRVVTCGCMVVVIETILVSDVFIDVVVPSRGLLLKDQAPWKISYTVQGPQGSWSHSALMEWLPGCGGNPRRIGATLVCSTVHTHKTTRGRRGAQHPYPQPIGDGRRCNCRPWGRPMTMVGGPGARHWIIIKIMQSM